MNKSNTHPSQSTKVLSSIPTTRKVLTAAILQALALQAAQAATVEVTSNLDNGTDCTLREAVQSVNMGSNQGGCSSTGTFGSNDTISFAPSVSGSTITLTGGEIRIDKDVSINPNGSETTISGLSGKFYNGAYGLDVSLDHLVLTGADIGASGGAIFWYCGAGAANRCTLSLTNSTITGNSSMGNGGGLWISNTNATISDSELSGNTAVMSDGGAIAAFDSVVSLTNTTISGNSADYFGGGIFAEESDVSLTNTTVSANLVGKGSGGGIRVNDSALDINASTLSINSVYFSGGGIDVHDSTVSLSNVTVSDNTAKNGAGIRIYANSSMSLTHSTVSDNTAGSNGGGLRVSNSTVTFSNSTVADNTAGDDGGGLYAVSSSAVTLTNSTVSGNSVADRGGGLQIRWSTVTELTNSTVSGNTAGNDGGGLYLYRSTALLSNSTMSNNTAPVGSGVVLYRNVNNPVSTLTLENSIIANGAGGGQDCERIGNVLGHNFIMGPDNIVEDNGCFGTPQTIDPGLMVLAANGGPTETHALMPGSPAIDGGNNLTCETTDQRGETRDDGTCDIGAYEFNAILIPIARKDRKMGSFMNGGEQWYSFDSTESQKLSMQTNGFSGDTLLEFYTGSDPKQVNPQLNMDDDSGPDLFSNIKHNVTTGPHLIRVKGKTNVDPYWLRLMSDKDILSFNDTASHFANKEIRVMSSAGITGGCGTGVYCPTSPVTRAQMAIFMLKAILGGNHSSPPASGTVFSDVGTSSFGANFIEEFSTLGITSGCGGGKYCPDLAVTREQMAVFLLRAWYGSSYTPPAATPAEINQFSDIANSFARDWIVQLTKENITGGCGGGKYCPTDTVTRGQMAAFIARTFDLDVEL